MSNKKYSPEEIAARAGAYAKLAKELQAGEQVPASIIKDMWKVLKDAGVIHDDYEPAEGDATNVRIH